MLAVVAVLYRPLLLLSFDPQRAAALGLPVERLHLVMLVLVALAVVIGFRVVGALLVLGLLIAPPAAAALVTKRLPAMMARRRAARRVSAPLGLLLSWHLDIAAGGADRARRGRHLHRRPGRNGPPRPLVLGLLPVLAPLVHERLQSRPEDDEDGDRVEDPEGPVAGVCEYGSHVEASARCGVWRSAYLIMILING